MLQRLIFFLFLTIAIVLTTPRSFAFIPALEQAWDQTAAIYLTDQTPSGRFAQAHYYNFNSVSYDGTSHNYLKDAYKPRYTNWELGFATYITNGVALLWAPSSGQQSEKLTVDPALKLGVHYLFGLTQTNRTNNPADAQTQYFKFAANHIIGGQIREKACLDDLNRQYNCRTARSVRDTPLIDQGPLYKNSFLLEYHYIANLL